MKNKGIILGLIGIGVISVIFWMKNKAAKTKIEAEAQAEKEKAAAAAKEVSDKAEADAKEAADKLAKEADQTQKDAAKKLGLTIEEFIAWEKGKSDAKTRMLSKGFSNTPLFAIAGKPSMFSINTAISGVNKLKASQLMSDAIKANTELDVAIILASFGKPLTQRGGVNQEYGQTGLGGRRSFTGAY